MEVHHHSHTARKKWIHYFWEFLMLFLAVFCGFLAENYREGYVERHREKEFIISMIEDAAKDTANIHSAISLNMKRIDYADSLAIACFSYKGTQKENTMIYKSHRNCIYRPDLVYPTERTLSQLKNSGGMRLIRKKRASESIIAYDEKGKMLVNQQAYYEMYLTEATNTSFQLMSFLELWGEHKSPLYKYDSAQMINTDKTKLMEFGNKVMAFKGILKQYITRLDEMEKQAIELITTLKKEYHLK
jgi:hypothetical protein